jgi:hypothetical protein
MMGIGGIELIIMLLVYPLGALFMALIIGVGILLGFRWGGKWLVKAMYNDPEFEAWLKRVLASPEKPDQ